MRGLYEGVGVAQFQGGHVYEVSELGSFNSLFYHSPSEQILFCVLNIVTFWCGMLYSSGNCLQDYC